MLSTRQIERVDETQVEIRSRIGQVRFLLTALENDLNYSEATFEHGNLINVGYKDFLDSSMSLVESCGRLQAFADFYESRTTE